MKPQIKTPTNMIFNEIQTNDGKINIDHSTQPIIKSFLMEYRIEPKYWQEIIIAWYKNHPYIPLKDIDGKTLLEFTINFKVFLLGKLREIQEAELKEFEELYIGR